ncbi:MAG: diguanylate cyclase [Pseudomonas sp.]|uniref:sensor domain-containing diguanylate cyclase n=1 Tax=Pseudomonas sp. TaxID=306 RepID=UPI003BB5C294
MPRRLAPYLRLIMLCLLLGLARGAWAQPLHVDALPAGHAGLLSQVLQEEDGPLTVEQAQTRFQQGQGQPGQSPILNFGIGSRPTWLQLQLLNASNAPVSVLVVTGTTWIDALQLSLLQDGQLLKQWQSGDTLAGAAELIPGIGYVVPLQIPSGSSELYLRAQSPDPLVLPIEVLSEQSFVARDREYKFVYGLIYGFLLSLIVYNSMLFIGLRDRSYLYYSIYLSLFALLNFAYSGHGFAWVWPNNPLLQNHIILICMVLFGCSGLAFASSFLDLAQNAPKALRLLKALAAIGISGLLISLLLGQQSIEALLAFGFSLVATVSMALLGVTPLRHRRVAGRYYQAATLCGMLGAVITTLTVWGALPFTGWNYGAVKIGIILQATLLALGLSLKVRQQQTEKLHAERLAEHDPLTGLLNRRGFNQQAATLWSSGLRNQRPLSLIMLDLDHFKRLNDQYGHDLGDQALEAVAKLLERSCRTGDLTTRWGGEEFLLLLPETDLAEALALAERLRLAIQAITLQTSDQQVCLSGSFGVAARTHQQQLEQLINEADRHLYVAKQGGRNQVCASASTPLEAGAQ